jgi:hypothetical protein
MVMLLRMLLTLLCDTTQLTKYSATNPVPGNLINAPTLSAATLSVMNVNF